MICILTIIQINSLKYRNSNNEPKLYHKIKQSDFIGLVDL